MGCSMVKCMYVHLIGRHKMRHQQQIKSLVTGQYDNNWSTPLNASPNSRRFLPFPQIYDELHQKTMENSSNKYCYDRVLGYTVIMYVC